MSYSPTFIITNPILRNVGTIDAAREVITHSPLVPAWERRFQEGARARIIHHGTHLEGNALNINEVEQVLDSPSSTPEDTPVTGRQRDLQEVINYRAVMDYLDRLKTTNPPTLTGSMLQEIHRLTVARLLPEAEAGQYRTVKVVIRNTTTGEITFRPPPPLAVPTLIHDLFSWLASDEGSITHPLLRAGILHYELARIHPFTDGNGRASRAAALLLLYLEGYEAKKFFSLEDYYDSRPEDYYQTLKSVELKNGDLTSWLEYFTLGIAIEFTRVKEEVQKLSLDLKLKSTLGGKQIVLSDRQIKLIEYLERFGTLTMKDGRELLPQVSDDTILRDLRELVTQKLITRHGSTKGTRYFLTKT